MSQIQLKRGSADSWTTQNPILADGQPGLEKQTSGNNDSYNLKIGNGTSNWNSLPYFNGNTQYLTTSTTSPVDCNDLTETGTYIVALNGSAGSTSMSNAPPVISSSYSYPMIIKVINSGSKILQEFTSIYQTASASYLTYSRARGSSMWSRWSLSSGSNSSYDISTISSSVNTLSNKFEWGTVGTTQGSQPTLTHSGVDTVNLSLSYFKSGNHVTVWGQMPSSLNSVTETWTINNALPYPIVPSNYQQLIFIGENCIGVIRYNNGNPVIQPITSWMSTNWEAAADTPTWDLSYWIINFSYISTF